jgi:IS5 family transposase
VLDGVVAEERGTGAEGRISHLKRGYGLDRSRLKGDTGHQICAGWAALNYNAETYTILR